MSMQLNNQRIFRHTMPSRYFYLGYPGKFTWRNPLLNLVQQIPLIKLVYQFDQGKLVGKLALGLLLGCFISPAFAGFVPLGSNENKLYYKIGGGSDFGLPPVSDTRPITLAAGADLSIGYGCGAFNPALSITNSINQIKSDVDNLEQSIVGAATGSIAQMPMYLLAKADPSAYNALNNALLSAHEKISLSIKNCEQIKSEIAHGKNPYTDWGTLSVGDRWKQHLSLTANGTEDINAASADVDQNSGNDGVSWVQGNKDSAGTPHAGGQNQPPVQVIADTAKAGYNALLMRDLSDSSPAPTGSQLASEFPAPADAVTWITNVVGDQTITTCNDASCKSNQGGVAGRGLLPWITNCNTQNKADCIDTIRTNLANLVSGQTDISKQNLQAVSGTDLFITPDVINSIQKMNSTQQGLLINKLAQEAATQRIIEKALQARTILRTGSQVPVIAANQPAQAVIDKSIEHLDKDIQSITFESNVRKQLMSNTLSDVLNYQNSQQAVVANTQVTAPAAVLDNSALPTGASK